MATPRPQRIPLSRDRALTAAVALADEAGIDAVSMRNLAQRLGVVPMALYKHVANKEDLLDGMIDSIVAGYAPPAPDLGWKAEIRARVLAARVALGRHPWARSVFETRTHRTPTVLGYLNDLTGAFLAGGLSPHLTHHAMHALGHRIWGFSPEAFDDPDAAALPTDAAEVAALMARMAATFPHVLTIAMAAGTDGAPGACDEQSEFEFTLDLLLDAFEGLHEAGWPTGPRP